MKNQAKTKQSLQPKWLTLLRVILGVILLLKGFSFIMNTSHLELLMQQRGGVFNENARFLSFLIPWVHIIGGFFIITGLITRWAALAQVPILVGAVFFVNPVGGIQLGNSELILSSVVLILLIVFVIAGSGILSADEYFRTYYKAGYEKNATRKIFE